MAGSPSPGQLYDACGAAVSLIAGTQPPLVDAADGTSPAERVASIASASGGYSWLQPHGHLVLYPDERAWESPVEVGELSGRRLDVADDLMREIAAQVAALSDLAGVLQKGDPASPVFARQVTVGGRATVVEHLAALLAEDFDVAFALQRVADVRVLTFERVGGTQ